MNGGAVMTKKPTSQNNQKISGFRYALLLFMTIFGLGPRKYRYHKK